MDNQTFEQRLINTQLLGLDVDGVLTDGGVYILDDGSEFRRFNIKDGLGLKRVMSLGVLIAIISASTSRSILHRAQKLGIQEIHLGAENKLDTLVAVCERYSIELSQVAYMGDDLADLEILQRVGLPCAPSNAVNTIKTVATFITKLQGGEGAVRELCDHLVEVHSFNVKKDTL